MHPTEIAEAIRNLQESGKIIEFGVSNFTPAQVDLISNKIKVSVNQIVVFFNSAYCHARWNFRPNVTEYYSPNGLESIRDCF